MFESIAGGVNTWFRTGKLFPGPHLFAGAGNVRISYLSEQIVDQREKEQLYQSRLILFCIINGQVYDFWAVAFWAIPLKKNKKKEKKLRNILKSLVYTYIYAKVSYVSSYLASAFCEY